MQFDPPEAEIPTSVEKPNAKVPMAAGRTAPVAEGPTVTVDRLHLADEVPNLLDGTTAAIIAARRTTVVQTVQTLPK